MTSLLCIAIIFFLLIHDWPICLSVASAPHSPFSLYHQNVTHWILSDAQNQVFAGAAGIEVSGEFHICKEDNDAQCQPNHTQEPR
jgi:hypothetical protein